MQKPGISPFFTASTPSLNTQGALNTTEARFIINQLLSQQAPVSQSKEKVKKITDMRELPELGTFEHNRDVSRYYLLFSGNMTSRGNPALRISLVERIAGTKRMINRQTNEIEEVPTIKKSSKITLIATGASNNKFSWQKITNEDSAEQPEHDDERTLQFKDEGKLIEGPFRPWFQSKNRIINTYKYRKPLKSALKKTPAFQGVND